jgi:tetratricopeptide (TPR) repeat protein
VAWWATWPAEHVIGSMVTDRVAYSLFELPAAEAPAGMVYPDALAPEISRLRVDVDEIGYEDLKTIVDVPRQVFDQARLAISSPDGYRNPVSHLLRILASTRTYHNIALSLLKRQKAGLTLVYYEGLDEVNHRFAQYLPPSMGLARATDPKLAAAFSDAVPAFYRLQDHMIGELVAAAPAQTVVMVVSDHGFANGAERPVDEPPDIEGRPGLWHTLDGVFLVAGPPIRPGRLANRPELLDVAPTLLALLGLSAAADMPGHAVSEIFLPGAEPRQPAVKVASYEEIGEPLQSVASGGASPEDPELIARLTALGYVQSSAPGAPAVGAGTPTYHINAGYLFISQNQLDRARDEFQRARDLAPRFDQPLLGLAQVELLKGRPGDALEYLEAALELVAAPQPALFTRVAQVYLKAKQQKRGLDFLGRLELTGRPEAFRLAALGILHEGSGDADQALTAYRRALEIDPSVERALYGAYVLLRKRGELEALADLLEKSLSVESIPVAVRAANWLALTRELQGRRPEARAILSAALAKAPDDTMTLINLGSMLLRDGMARESVVPLENAVRLQPESFEVLVNLVVAYGKLGNLDRARGYFAEGEKVAKRPALYNAMAYACYLNGAKEDARSYLAKSFALDPGQKEARTLQQQMERGTR